MTVTEHHAEYAQYNPKRSLAEQLLEWSRAGKRSGTAFAAMVEAVAALETSASSLPKAVEANRMLTERLEAYEVRDAALRSVCSGLLFGTEAIGLRAELLSILDHPVGSVHTEQQEKP